MYDAFLLLRCMAQPRSTVLLYKYYRNLAITHAATYAAIHTYMFYLLVSIVYVVS